MNPIIERLVNEKVDEALKSATIPKKFFITENGRGAVADAVSIMKAAIGEILSEIVVTQQKQAPAPAPAPQPQPAPKSQPSKAKVTTKK